MKASNSLRPRNQSRLLYLTILFAILDLSCCFLHPGVTFPNFGCSGIESRHHALVGNYPSSSTADSISLEKYQHKNFNLTYLYKKAAPGRENDDPIVMIHPVGVGLSSWFWIRVMQSYENNPPMYAPDLIGCGIDHGSDPWDPEKVGLFFPLSWVEGVETLMQEVLQASSSSSWINNVVGGNSKKPGCLVVSQGGLAPVGIMLATRNPDSVKALMLASPPTYKDVTTAVPQAELQRNYEFLRSPFWGKLAFSILENRAIIRFFSDLFLFSEKCDERWLDETEKESKFPQARTPIQAFNAGLLQHRSFEMELQESTQPLMVVSGVGDKRAVDRLEYQSTATRKECRLETIEGTNVLPWENPNGIVELMRELGF